MASLDEQAKLDAALDAALDDLDSDDEEPESAERSSSIPAATPPPVMMGPPRPPVVESENGSMPDDWSPEKLFATMMQHMIEGGEGGGGDGSSSTENEFIGRLMHEMQTQLQSDLGAPPTIETEPTTVTSGTNNGNQAATPTASTTSSASSKTKRSRSVKVSPSAGKEEIEAAISNLVRDLSKQATMNDDVGNASSLPDSDTDMLNSIMEGLAGIGGGQADGDDGFNPDAVIDGMMEQLLSKDLMYEPMKQVATKFPGWLEERQSTLSPKKYAERCKQCECFQKLVDVYETEPNNTGKLMELMQEVQEYGQPPVEIIQEIAPGIELDDDGMPKLDGSGLPFPGNEECRII